MKKTGRVLGSDPSPDRNPAENRFTVAQPTAPMTRVDPCANGTPARPERSIERVPVSHVSSSPARLWQGATRPETLLKMLWATSPQFVHSIAPDIRRFACWCARDAGAASTGAVPHRVLHAAEKFAAGNLPAAALAAEKRSAAGLEEVADADAARHQPVAALQLAAIWTAHERAFEAAGAAVHYTVLAALWRDGESAAAALRIRQAAALRFFVPHPLVPEAHRSAA